MTREGTVNFSELNDAEKLSKLRQLVRSKGVCVLWKRGQGVRVPHRVSDLSASELLLHVEPNSWHLGEELLASFDLGSLSFFFKTKITASTASAISVSIEDKCFKSERRRNFRLLAFPAYDISVELRLGAAYEGGNVISLTDRSSQTGLFKSFLRIVSPDEHEVSNLLRARVQDLSLTGFSIHVGEADLGRFSTGSELTNLRFDFGGEVVDVPKAQVVYVVDFVGHSAKALKTFKVGVRFTNLPDSIESTIAAKMSELLRRFDSNRDFEDFSQ